MEKLFEKIHDVLLFLISHNGYKTSKTKLLSELFDAMMCKNNQIILILKNLERKWLFYIISNTTVSNYPVNEKWKIFMFLFKKI